MPDDPYDDSPAAATPAQPAFAPVEPQVTDVGRAEGYLRQHEARAKTYGANYEDVMKQRQDAVKQVQSTLDQTIQEMRDKHEGKGPGQINLPLAAFASGMLSGTGPGAGNFGAQLGRGMGAMTSTIQHQRMADSQFLKGVADLQAKSGELSDIPLKDAATLARMQQIQEQRGADALQGKIITAKLDQPKSLGKDAMGNPIIWDPKANNGAGAIQNGGTGKGVNLDNFAAGPDGKSLIGSQVHGDDFLKSFSPDAPFSPTTIKSIANYDVAGPAIGGRSPMISNYNQKLLDAVKQYRPDFDANGFKQQQDIWKEFSNSGKTAKNITALDTAYGHIGLLHDMVQGLNNNNPQIVNSIISKANEALGGAKYVGADAVAGAVSHELAKVFRDTGMSIEDAAEWQKRFDVKKMSKDQMAAAIPAALQLMEERKKALETQYQRAGGRKDTSSWFTPEHVEKAEAIRAAGPQSQQPAAPQAGTTLGRTRDGREIYVGPDGKKYVR